MTSTQQNDELLDQVDEQDRVIGSWSRSAIYREGLNAERVIEEEDLDYFTIGVPLFGSDTGGLSTEDSCNAICDAMKAHFKNNRESLISQILIVNKKPEVCNAVNMILGQHFVLS